jgi:cysteinyl-tRNA synthetase
MPDMPDIHVADSATLERECRFSPRVPSPLLTSRRRGINRVFNPVRGNRIIILFCFILSCVELSAAPLSVGSWGYQLDDIVPRVIADSPYDLVVMDYSRDGSDAGAFTADEISRMKTRQGRHDKIILSYMSIGEAEDYRYYWQGEWKQRKPSWLDKENPDWPGNYKVRYWDKHWQHLFYGSPNAYLDKIIAAGFDGVYLDIIDAFEYYQGRKANAAELMVEFVSRLSRYAKQRNPDFLIIGQNGESLVENKIYVHAIDGIAKEDLYYGLEREGSKNPQHEIDFSLQYLIKAKTLGKMVLAVTYARDASAIRRFYAESRKHGFIPYAGNRQLNVLMDPDGHPIGAIPQIRESDAVSKSGDFFAVTAKKGEKSVRYSLEGYRERSTYTERDASGAITYQEKATYREGQFLAKFNYGLTDYLEVGLIVPVINTTEAIRVTVGGDPPSQTMSRGMGNIRLTSAIGRRFNHGATNLLLEAEFGLPTDTRRGDISGGASGRLELSGDHYWGRIGVMGSISNDYMAARDYVDWTYASTYQIGIGAEVNARLFGSLTFGESEGINVGELSVEHLIGSDRSLEFTLGGDLKGDRGAVYIEGALTVPLQ